MSRAQAPQSRAQPQDGAASPPPPAPAMLQLPLPLGRPQHPANHTSLYAINDIDSSSDLHNDLAYDSISNNTSSNNTSSNSSSHGIPSEANALTTHHHRHHNYLNAESHVGRNSHAVSSRVPAPGGLELTTLTSAITEEQQQRAVEEFYRSYDPQIGLHTAAVLGGILGWLIVYLLYKTKVKKWAVTLVHGKQHRRQRLQLGVCEVLGDQQATTTTIPNHHFCPPQFQQYGQFQQVCQDPEEACRQDHLSSRQSSCSSGKPGKRSGNLCPMPSIVIESYSPPSKVSKTAAKRKQASEAGSKQPSHKPRHKSKPAKRPSKKGQKYQRIGGGSRSSSRNKRCPEVTVLDADDPDTVPFLLPPCCDADSARATARWVQSMPLVMQSYQDLTGLILKVHPLMVGAQKPQSCPMISAALRFAALPVLGPPNVGWNKSLPLLTDKTGAGSLQDSELDSVFSPADKHPVNADGKPPVLSSTSTCRPPEVRPRTFSASTPSTGTSRPPSCGPPPRLPFPASDQLQFLSAVSLAVPGAQAFPGACAASAPASPVPLPVTPLVTIQHFPSSRSCRNSNSALPLQHQQRGDSQDSFSSSSSAEALLHVLEPGCHVKSHASAFFSHSPHLLPQPCHHPHVSRSSPHIASYPAPNACQHAAGVVLGGAEVARSASKQKDCCHDQTVASKVPDPIFTLETKL